MMHHTVRPLWLTAATAALLFSAAGCKSTVDDATLNTNAQAALHNDSNLSGQPIQVAVQNGVVTLNGSVSDKTARNLAANDIAQVKGVKEVVNNLAIGTPSAQVNTAALPPVPVSEPQPQNPPDRVMVMSSRASAKPSPVIVHEPAPPPPAPVAEAAPPPPPPVHHEPPPPPPAPVERAVTLTMPEGTALPVRITQTLDSQTATAGQSFSGVVTRDITRDGYVVLPAGASISGRVVDARDATHFSGSSLLSVELTSARRHGVLIPLHTEPYVVEGKGRGKNTAEKVGGGAAVGALLGGLLGGGKGAAIGAGVGGAGGAGVQAATRGQQVQINSESILDFRTTAPFSVTTTEHVEGNDNPGGLQPR